MLDRRRKKRRKKDGNPNYLLHLHPHLSLLPACISRSPREQHLSLTEKEFINITHSKPRIEWKNILKDFFNEMNISDYSRVPGDFVSGVNALKLVTGADEQKIASLKSLIQSFRPVVVPEKAAEPKVKKLVEPNISSSVKKSTSKTGRTGRARQVGKRRSVNELPKPRGIKPKKRVKHAKKAKTHKNEIHLLL